MNYQQTIEFLYSRLPMFTRIGQIAYKKDLHNTEALLNFLNNPQKKFKSVHIAGTNGKGSTSNMLAAILQTAGYKTGLYTSPHIKDFRERIRVDGKMVDEKFVINFTQDVMQLIDDVKPSFFELTVAMAFEYFAKEKVDVAIIETGLGGRLDSTNVITPILSVITNIGFDHVNILGNTLEKIAIEKAGIIKQGIPVIVGEYLPETKNVFIQKAQDENAPLIFAQDKYKIENVNHRGKYFEADITDLENNITEHFRLSLNGAYQAKNLLTAIAAEGELIKQGFAISSEQEKQALINIETLTGLRGRWEIVQDKPTVVYDVGHNEDGISYIVKQAAEDYPLAKKHFIIGFVRDKDVEKALKLFPKDAYYYFTNAHLPRALPVAELHEIATGAGLAGNTFKNVNDAIKAAKSAANEDDIIIVCGSFFIIAEID